MGGVLLAVIAATTLYFYNSAPTARADLIFHTVRYGPLELTIVERGTLESAKNADIYCKIKTGTGNLPQIKDVIADGTLVKKGDLLMVIESSRYEDQRDQQEIALSRARNDMLQAEEKLKIVLSQNVSDISKAKVALELAELDYEKYIDGDYMQRVRDIEGRRTMAKSDLEQQKDKTDWAVRAAMRDFVTRAQARAEQARQEGAEINLGRIIEELRVLNNYEKRAQETTKKSAITQAQEEVKRVESQAKANESAARTDLDTKTLVFKREQQRFEDIQAEIEKCKIYAPQDGMAVYYVPETGRGGSQLKTIAQGETVSEGQKLMQIPDLTRMVVNTKIHEALVSRVHRDQETEIRVDAFPNKLLKGRVKSVAAVASKPDNWSSADVKTYPTYVEIDDEFEGLKPGMSAAVTIHTSSPLEHVLTIPMHAIVGSAEMGSHRKVFVKGPDGPQEREISIGLFNDTFVEVKEGLSEGEEVVVNPRALVGDKVRTRTGKESRQSNENGVDSRSPTAPPNEGPGISSPGDSPDGPPVEGRGKGRGKAGGRRGGRPGGEPPPEN
jgi:multidrug resistance efflux pump